MPKFRWQVMVIGLLLLLIGLIGLYGSLYGWPEEGGDIKFGIIAGDGVGMVSLSQDRGMVNILRVKSEVELWIPKGLGWYRADRVGRILSDEGKSNLAEEVFFYNFGFIPNQIVNLPLFDQWPAKWQMLKLLGFKNWFWFQLDSRDRLRNYTEVDKRLLDYPDLGEILLRDFADSKLVNSDVRISVVNGTEISGLAQFAADRLNWLGLSVVSTENASEKFEGECRVELADNLKEDMAELGVFNRVWNCEIEKDKSLSDNEMTLTIGEKLASVIKYLSYNNLIR